MQGKITLSLLWEELRMICLQWNKLFVIAVLILMLSGCAATGNAPADLSNVLEKIDTISFSELNYERYGASTTAKISATNSRIQDGIRMVDDIEIDNNYGVLGHFKISIKGWEREAFEGEK